LLSYNYFSTLIWNFHQPVRLIPYTHIGFIFKSFSVLSEKPLPLCVDIISIPQNTIRLLIYHFLRRISTVEPR
jgi:hypothetical protein